MSRPWASRAAGSPGRGYSRQATPRRQGRGTRRARSRRLRQGGRRRRFLPSRAAGEEADRGRQHRQEQDRRQSVPPTTTMASGRWTWLPMRSRSAAGSRPTQAAMQVISTGRICGRQVSRSARARGHAHSTQAVVAADSTMMPFMAAMPNRATKPMAAEMLNVMPADERAPATPPVSAIGIALPAQQRVAQACRS